MPITLNGSTGIRTTELDPSNLVTSTETIFSNQSDTVIPTASAVWQSLLPYTQTISLSGAASRRFSSLPAGLLRIKILLNNISSSDNTASGDFLIRIGSGGTVLSTGYNSVGTTYSVSRTSTTGFIVMSPGAASGITGHVELDRIPGTNLWKAWGHTKFTGAATVVDMWGDFIDTVSTVDTLDILTGAGTLDSGTATVIGYYF